jgi:hypothetical protein
LSVLIIVEPPSLNSFVEELRFRRMISQEARFMSVLTERIARTLSITNQLAEGLSAEALMFRNGKAASNTIGAQFWCVVGARESYARAFDAGVWQGFTCSLQSPEVPDVVRAALATSMTKVAVCLERAAQRVDATREHILVDLLEHETQHHGQLIRYFYANGLIFSEAFAKRYALEQP